MTTNLNPTNVPLRDDEQAVWQTMLANSRAAQDEDIVLEELKKKEEEVCVIF